MLICTFPSSNIIIVIDSKSDYMQNLGNKYEIYTQLTETFKYTDYISAVG